MTVKTERIILNADGSPAWPSPCISHCPCGQRSKASTIQPLPLRPRAMARLAASRCAGVMCATIMRKTPASAQQCDLDMTRRIAIEGAVIGRQQILHERQRGRHLAKLRPECAAHALAVIIEMHRLVSHRSLRCRIAAQHQIGSAIHRCKATGAQAAKRSIVSASLMSSSVTPPASCVESVTSTVL